MTNSEVATEAKKEKVTYTVAQTEVKSIVAAPPGWVAVFKDDDGEVWEEPVAAWCVYESRLEIRCRKPGYFRVKDASGSAYVQHKTHADVIDPGQICVSAGGLYRDRAAGYGLSIAEEVPGLVGYRAPGETTADFWKHAL